MLPTSTGLREVCPISFFASAVISLFIAGTTFADEDSELHAPPRNDGTSWPTLHGDLRRSGFYPEFPGGGLRVVWRKELYRELTGTRSEIIVGGGTAYLGTYAGTVYAWDAATGEERWVFHAGGPVMHSPMLSGGRLFVASMDRTLYALDAVNGKVLWRFEAGGGFWASPVVHAGRVLIGARDGLFYAVDSGSGKRAWTFETGDRILGTASISPDGRSVLFASEDIRAYSLDVASGKLNWRSRKMHGASARDHFPTVVGDVAIFTTNPVDGFHEVLGRHQALFLEVARERGAVKEGLDPRYIPYDEEGFRREQRTFLDHLRRVPSDQTFYAFRLSDGAEPWVAPVAYTAGLHNPPTPPCYRPGETEVYLYVRSAYGVWDGGGEVRPYSGVGKLDVTSGRVDLLMHGYPSSDAGRGAGRKDMPWGSFWTIGDETQTLSLSERALYSNHQSSIGALDFETGRCRLLFGKRDTYGGYYGPGRFGWGEEGRRKARAEGQPFGIVNEWHGPCKSIASVAGGRVYFHVGSQVLCLETER